MSLSISRFLRIMRGTKLYVLCITRLNLGIGDAIYNSALIPLFGWHLLQTPILLGLHQPHSCKAGTMHLSSTTYQRNLCGKDENKATLSARRCFHTWPGRCSKPAEKHRKCQHFSQHTSSRHEQASLLQNDKGSIMLVTFLIRDSSSSLNNSVIQQQHHTKSIFYYLMAQMLCS
jgi:hypothetical protein